MPQPEVDPGRPPHPRTELVPWTGARYDPQAHLRRIGPAEEAFSEAPWSRQPGYSPPTGSSRPAAGGQYGYGPPRQPDFRAASSGPARSAGPAQRGTARPAGRGAAGWLVLAAFLLAFAALGAWWLHAGHGAGHRTAAAAVTVTVALTRGGPDSGPGR